MDTIAHLIAERQRFESFLAQRVRDPDVVDDLFQTALLKAVRGADTLRDDERVTAWFYRILRNVLTDHWRSEGARARSAEQLETVGSDTVPPAEIEPRVCACVGALLDTLPEQYARMLRLVELEEVSPTEAASRLGLSAGNGRVRLHRARTALRQRVEEFCRTCARHGCLDCTCRATAPEV